jgi:ATP-binding protein involved in chromosome partitioning
MLKPSPVYSHAVQNSLPTLPGIKNIIAVGSGKGGVGKSTVAFHLAHGLIEQGYQVGLVDADIYGPSVPALTGVFDRVHLRSDKKFQPHYSHGLYFLSIGHLVDEKTAMIWRGPMACGALMQLFHNVAWPSLDYLIVDLPPGTGDLLLTLCQKIPLSAILFVTHPHCLAYADFIRAQAMFEKLGVFDLGVVLNHFEPHELKYKNIISTIPYNVCLRRSAHKNHLSLMQSPDGAEIAQIYSTMASYVHQSLSQRPLSFKVPLNVLG